MRFPKLFKKILKKGLHFASGCGMIIKPSREAARTVGVDYDEGPPVPIPNTEVKLVRAENTWLVTAREDRCSPTQEAVAQSGGCFFASAAQAIRARA